MEITATVSFPEWEDDDDEVIRGAIVREAAATMLEGAESDITEAVRQAVLTTIKIQIGPIIEGVIAEPVRRTNAYGEARGDPVTLRELILKNAKEWLEQSVNPRDGKPTRMHRDNPVSRAHYLTRVAVRQELEQMYRTEIAEAVAEVRAELDAGLGEMVQGAIKSLLGVK